MFDHYIKGLTSKGGKMKEYDDRIAIRLTSEQRQQATQLISQKKFKNLSDLIRAAIQEFLSTHN
jgi:metal-responsive CopG/Arc/MetJ family transcriptional regulator